MQHTNNITFWSGLGQSTPCAKDLAGIAVFPGDPRYNDSARIWNPAYSDIRPAFVALPKTILEVQQCVACAYNNNVHFTMKSGGHSTDGMSTIDGSKDGAFVIYLHQMKGVKIVDDTAEVEAGATWNDVYTVVRNTSYLIPGGDSATVGVAGYTLGGGMSIISRMYGLAIDHVISFTMVTVQGTDVVTASSMSNADLFWALRGGGGGNFGIVVSITFRLLPSFTSYTFGYMLFDNVSASMVLSAIGENDFDLEFDMELYLVGNRLNLTYMNLGPISTNTESKLAAFAKFAIILWRNNYSTYWEAFYTKFPARGLLDNGLPYVTRGCMLQTITPSVTKTLVNSNTPEQCFHSFNHLGGKIAQFNSSDTAYPHRSSKFEIYSTCSYKNSAEKIIAGTYLSKVYSVLRSSGQCQGNFVNDPELDLHDWQHKYYGDNYGKLVEIQQKWNPSDKGTYHYIQSIGSNYNPPPF